MANYIRWYSIHTQGTYATHYEDFTYKDGVCFEDNLSEMLDSGLIVLNRKSKNNFEPFDIVDIVNDNFTTRRMLIDNVVETQVGFNPDIFDYTINLMSLTKGLERVIVPNFSVTKPLNGTAKTLRQVIVDLIQDYAPKYLCYTSDHVLEFFNTIQVPVADSRLNVKCPDMQMNKCTLREAIDRVLSVISCICKVNDNNRIELVDLNQKNNEIDQTKLNYKNENQSSSDYASDLDNEYANVTPNNNIDDIDNITRVTEYIGFRNANDGIVSDENMQLETKYPIYNIEKIIMCVPVTRAINSAGASEQDYAKIDITNYVKEQQEWSLLKFGELPQSGSNVYFRSETNKIKPNKINTVYYSRGDNKIVNWYNKQKKLIVSYYTIGLLIASAFITQNADVYGAVANYITNSYRKDCSFIITYQAQIDRARTSSGKLLPETHENNSMIDNAGEAFVDIYQQGRLFNEKVNRLGNRVKVVTGRYKYTDTLPQLGDYIGDFILMNREIQYYDNFIVFKGTLTENFVNINYFTGLNARKRSWNLVSASEAFDKQLLDKYYCEFSFNKKINIDNEYIDATDINKTGYLAETLAQIDNGGQPAPVDKIFVTNDYIKKYKNNVEEANFIELECQKLISGNSLLITFGMLDNFSSAIPSIVDYNKNSQDAIFNEGEGGIIELWNKYVNDNGQCNSYSVAFMTPYYEPAHGYNWNQGDSIHNIVNMPVNTYINYDQVKKGAGTNIPYINSYQGFKPRVYCPRNDSDRFDFDEGECFFAANISNVKDSRETVNFNFQFEFCTDTKDIIFTKLFLARQLFICTESLDEDYDFYYSPNEYKRTDETLQANSSIIDDAVFNITATEDGSAKYELYSETRHTGHKSIAIVRHSDNALIMAVNTTIDLGDDKLVWYLNVFKNRDRKIYLDTSMTQWVYEAADVYKQATSISDLQVGKKVLFVTKPLLASNGGGIADVENHRCVPFNVDSTTIVDEGETLKDYRLQVVSISGNNITFKKSGGTSSQLVNMVQSGLLVIPSFDSTAKTFTFDEQSLRTDNSQKWLGHITLTSSSTFLEINSSSEHAPSNAVRIFYLD